MKMDITPYLYVGAEFSAGSTEKSWTKMVITGIDVRYREPRYTYSLYNKNNRVTFEGYEYRHISAFQRWLDRGTITIQVDHRWSVPEGL